MIWTPEILSDFKQGRIEVFYRTIFPGLIAYAVRHLGVQKEYLAEDVVQEAVFKAWRRRESFRSVYAFKAFLFTAIRNAAIDLLRKESAHSRYVVRSESEDEAIMADIEAQILLFNAIEQLPDKMRQVIELGFFEGMKNNDIARQLALSLSSVNKYKAGALEILREKLNPAMLILLMSRLG